MVSGVGMTINAWNSYSRLAVQTAIDAAAGTRDKIVFIVNAKVATQVREWVNNAGIVIPITNLDDSEATLSELEEALTRNGVKLRDWVNIQDQFTPTYLYCAERILDPPPLFLQAYANCRIKPLARTLATAAGLSQLQFQVICGSDSMAPPSMSFPLIAKPVSGTASTHVQRIIDLPDWERYRGRYRPSRSLVIQGFDLYSDILVEQFCAMTEIEIDGFVQRGDLRITGIGRKFHQHGEKGPREIGGVLYRPGAIPNQCGFDGLVSKWTEALLKAVSFETGVFHLEAFSNGLELELVEINPRPGGFGIVELNEALRPVRPFSKRFVRNGAKPCIHP